MNIHQTRKFFVEGHCIDTNCKQWASVELVLELLRAAIGTIARRSEQMKDMATNGCLFVAILELVHVGTTN